MLSPRQTPSRIIAKWENRVDTKNFYNRVLGRPYADPNTLPVTEAHLHAAQNPDLKWGPLPRRACDGIFMGIDQMGQENYVVIKAKVANRMRLLHLEIIQSADPWRRCAELMREYHVRSAVVESLPNFNEAQRFAMEYDGRVFLASYQDQADEVLRWGDRFRDAAGVSRSDDAIRTRWTVLVDQYKMMSWSLGRWAAGEIETPDARTLIRPVRTRRGVENVMLCRDVLWLHLQRVALVTEPSREDERKLRRTVKKLGIDPHFAFANMLSDVGWVRAHGTARILFVDDHQRHHPAEEKKRSPEMEQLMEALPEFAEYIALQESEPLTCGDCANFDSQRRLCTERKLLVEANQMFCRDWFIARSSDDDEDDY